MGGWGGGGGGGGSPEIYCPDIFPKLLGSPVIGPQQKSRSAPCVQSL